MQVTIINATQHNGNRWLVSPIVGFSQLGYQVTWLGLQRGGFNLIYPEWTEEVPTPIPNIEFKDRYTEQEAIGYIKNSDIIIFNMNHGNYSPVNIHRWAELLNKYRPYDFFVFNGMDCATGGHSHDELKEFKYRHFIKREAYPWHKDILPYVGISTHSEWLRKQMKSISVSCLFGPNNGSNMTGYHRKAIRNAVNTIEKSYILDNSSYNFNDYLEKIASSRICVSVTGVGYTCYREWEILSNQTILALKRIPLSHYDQFKDMESIILFSTPEELLAKCDEVLNDDKLYMEILYNQMCITRNLHSPINRAQQLIEYSNMDRKDNYYEKL